MIGCRYIIPSELPRRISLLRVQIAHVMFNLPVSPVPKIGVPVSSTTVFPCSIPQFGLASGPLLVSPSSVAQSLLAVVGDSKLLRAVPQCNHFGLVALQMLVYSYKVP
jgi:hypothetical protein